MKHFFQAKFSFKNSSKGFTLIELLVVIGILGILAAALIATIDPFEQLKKANDANVKNTAVEYVDGNIRYFTTHNSMVWDNDANCNQGNEPSGDTANNILGNSARMSGCLTSLVADGEIKAAFTTATGILSSIIITGGTDSVTACYLPTSKSGQRDQNARYSANGILQTSGCLSQSGGSAACYWCSL